MIFDVLTNEPECVCCTFLAFCTAEPGTAFMITQEIRKRSNCDGGGFDHWDKVDETYFDGSEITVGGNP
jgi:hypothetical protein